MSRIVDTRILALGLLLGLALLLRPIDSARASYETTGSVPAVAVEAE